MLSSSPSWENTATHVPQGYVYNWTRDAAIAAIELAAGPLPTTQPLIDYLRFAQTCQTSASGIGHRALVNASSAKSPVSGEIAWLTSPIIAL
jgi:hypothetical protein